MKKYKVQNIKEMWLWLECEISLIHIAIFIIIGLLINNWIAWIILSILSMGDFVFFQIKVNQLLKENSK